jgi:hypothetical protein
MFLKKMMCNIKNFDYQIHLQNVVCGKYLVKAFNFAFMFSSGLSFRKAILSKGVA